MSDAVKRPSSTSRGCWPFAGQRDAGRYSLSLEAIAGWQERFQQFINLGSQIELIMSALESAIRTQFADRSHVLAYGPPGCGKSEVLRTLCNVLGTRHAQFFHAPSLTKAGAEEYLLSENEVASLIVLDELDKAPPDVGTAWLQLMSDNPEMNKTDARSGHRSRVRRILVIAAVNDPDRLSKRLSRALFDRFANRVFFPPPSAEDIQRILEAAADRSGIDRRCVTEVLNFARENEGTMELRRLMGLLRSGRDRWLDGQYAQHLMVVQDQERSYQMRQRTAGGKNGERSS